MSFTIREEQYLANIAGEDVEIPDYPITRNEMYLAKWAGENITTPEPLTREEQLLSQIAENGGGGGGGSSDLVEMEASADNYAITLNKTYNEIAAYNNDGKIPYFSLSQAELEAAYLEHNLAADVKYGAVFCEQGESWWKIEFVALGIVSISRQALSDIETYGGADVPYVIDYGG